MSKIFPPWAHPTAARIDRPGESSLPVSDSDSAGPGEYALRVRLGVTVHLRFAVLSRTAGQARSSETGAQAGARPAGPELSSARPPCAVRGRASESAGAKSFINKMLAVIAAMGNNRGTLSSSTRIRERRKFAIENLNSYVKGLEENASFREVMASQCESSMCLNAIELLELIQKFGTGTFVDSKGHEVDIVHHVSTSLQNRPPSPSADEISWILSAGSRLRANRMVASDIKFSLVSSLIEMFLII
jgi:hypothetical protein